MKTVLLFFDDIHDMTSNLQKIDYIVFICFVNSRRVYKEWKINSRYCKGNNYKAINLVNMNDNNIVYKKNIFVHCIHKVSGYDNN